MTKLSKKLLPLLWVLIFIIVLPSLAKSINPDSDTFFLAAAGRYIVENGEIPTVNPFVIHENFGIVIQQWGFDVIIYSMYNAMGNFGLVLYILITFGLFLFVLWKYIGLYTEKPIVKAMAGMLAAGIFLRFAVARPTTLTVILLFSYLFFLEKYYRTKKWQWLIALPVISLIQINVHSSMWVMLFVYSLPFFVPAYIPKRGEWKSGIQDWWNKHKLVFVATCAALVCGLANPYGLNGILYLFNSYGSAKGANISEMMAPTPFSIIWWPCAISAVLVIAYFAMNIKKLTKENTSLNIVAKVCMAAGATIMSFMHIRNKWFLIIGVLPIVIFFLEKLPPLPFEKNEENPKARTIAVSALTCIAIALSVFMFATHSYSTSTTVDSNYSPINALEYLETKNKDNVVLYTEFNNGAFFEWNRYKIYIDARPELYDKKINGQKEVMKEWLSVVNGTADYEQFLNDYNFTHLVVDNKPLYDYLNTRDDYQVVVEGNGYFLFEHVS